MDAAKTIITHPGKIVQAQKQNALIPDRSKISHVIISREIGPETIRSGHHTAKKEEARK